MNYGSNLGILYQVVPGPRQGGSFERLKPAIRNQWPIGKFWRCRSNEVLKLWGAPTNEQRVVEMPMKWLNLWINESMNEWVSSSMNQSINESMIQWTHESMNQWTSGVDESISQWFIESINSKNVCFEVTGANSKVIESRMKVGLEW